MRQISIHTASNQISVIEEVNEFLTDLGSNKLIDIKYSMVVRGTEIFYSALIIYEEDDNQYEDNDNV
ncbi:MAG: sporulation protein Cse60 [Nitrosopumilus sp.]|nr:sporulation protein Cse60 [Nitrosopumilus sp.]